MIARGALTLVVIDTLTLTSFEAISKHREALYLDFHAS